MTRVFQILFHVHRRIAEKAAGLLTRHGHGIHQRRLGMHDAHTTTATATGGLDDYRITGRARHAHDFLGVFRQGAVGTGNAGHARLFHRRLGRHLVAHQANRLGARADENETGSLDPLGKIGVLGQEAIARVNRLGVGHLGGRNDGGYIQVAKRRLRGADTNRFVSQFDVLGFTVGLGVHHNGLDTELAAGALDAQGNLAPVGDENFPEHGAISQ